MITLSFTFLQDAGMWPCDHSASPVISPLVWETDLQAKGGGQWPNLPRQMLRGCIPIDELDTATTPKLATGSKSETEPASATGGKKGGVSRLTINERSLKSPRRGRH